MPADVGVCNGVSSDLPTAKGDAPGDCPYRARIAFNKLSLVSGFKSAIVCA
jgi:hypothetical protein